MFMKNALNGLSIGLVGYLVGGIFLSAFYYPFFWNLSALMIAVYMVNLKREENSSPNPASFEF